MSKKENIMPKVELTNKQIWAARGAINQLMSQKFPVMVSYRLAKEAKKLQNELSVLNEVYNKLVEKHGQKDPKTGKPVVLQLIDENPNPAWDELHREWNEVLGQAVKLDIEKVKIPEKVASTCDKCHHNMDRPFEIEGSILMALDFLIEV
uniref:Uncharacterized protein n=1 Tax=viral metagenome TaxID=1070528 RepID=A0A6H1ZK45_9ZZZZ